MKKLFCLLFVLVLLPIVAFADDDIVGSWYMCFDKNATPEFASAFQDCDVIISVYTFWADGTITLFENDITDKSGTPIYTPTGKWEKTSSGYTYSIISLGSGAAIVDNDYIYLEVSTPVYLRLHKLIPLDPYTDYSRK